MNSLLEALGAILAGVWALLTPGRKKERLRTAIHDDLALLDALDARAEFGQGTTVHDALSRWISTEVLLLSSGKLKRRPRMNWTTLTYGAVMAIGFGFWTWRIDTAHPGLPWYGWVTGGLAIAGVLAILGE